ncbi:TetR/AcrR family transcriptional regulator [Tolumonas lignilytica]|uniref:TetR/AcrR family transcriptional regulator n=1 Tax=Tolumonas lignilytica TaxID=1283284 RepID=UPI0004647DD8|nr:TetR/AcrR family transcriptional regulator [Tolumonas lignilytica]
MARPKSEDKYYALLAAAISVCAVLGIEAPTAKIARTAGVAEGTLFTYFKTKDELLNQLYLELKKEMGREMLADYPRTQSLRERMYFVWSKYIHWGALNPDKRKVMGQLSVSDRITAETRAAGMAIFSEVGVLMDECIKQSKLQNSCAFASAMMLAMAETTMDFIIREPAATEHYCHTGFEAFWRVLAID